MIKLFHLMTLIYSFLILPSYAQVIKTSSKKKLIPSETSSLKKVKTNSFSPEASGSKLLVIVGLNFTNHSLSPETSESILGHRLSTIRDFYDHSSSGRQVFDIQNPNSGELTAYIHNINLSPSSCTSHYGEILDQVKNFLTTEKQLTDSMVKYLQIVYPTSMGCGSSGNPMNTCAGQICYSQVSEDHITNNKARFLIHEIGHNLGLNHAGTVSSSTNDNSSIMSYGNARTYPNSPNYDSLGWLPSSHKKIINESNAGVYELVPHPYLDATIPQGVYSTLIIERPSNSAEKYYVSFRKNSGEDIEIDTEFTLGPSIHAANTSGYYQTTLLKVLTASGEVYLDSDNIKIKHLGFTPSGHLRVQVTFNADCDEKAPLVEVFPMVGNEAEVAPQVYEAQGFAVKITNRDDPVKCENSKFRIEKHDFSSLQGTTSLLTQQQLLGIEIAPGESKTIDFRIYSNTQQSAGDHPVKIIIKDEALNIHQHSSVISDVVYRVEDYSITTVPHPPLNLKSEISYDINQNCKPIVRLKWEHNPLNTGSISYNIKKDQQLVSQSISNSKELFQLPQGVHTFSVSAVNAVNLSSIESEVITVTVPVQNSCSPQFGHFAFSVLQVQNSAFNRFKVSVSHDEEVEKYIIERKVIDPASGNISYIEVADFDTNFFYLIGGANQKIRSSQLHHMIEAPSAAMDYTYRLKALLKWGSVSVIDTKTITLDPSQWKAPVFTQGLPEIVFAPPPYNLHASVQEPVNYPKHIKFNLDFFEKGLIDRYVLEIKKNSTSGWEEIIEFGANDFTFGGLSHLGRKNFQLNYFGMTELPYDSRLKVIPIQGNSFYVSP